MCIGAPFVHVARLFVVVRPLATGTSGAGLYETTVGRGWESCSATGAEASDLPISDLLNQDDFEERLGGSLESLDGDLKLLSDSFRPSNLEVDDFGLNGSTASAKYS
jgi:hypothetical protein